MQEEKQVVTKKSKKSLAKNSIFYLVYNILNVIFPFITGIFVARVLLPSGVGQVAYAQNITQYFVILSFLGIPTYGLREISKARGNKDELNNVHSELFFLNLISTAIFGGIYLILIFSVGEFRENLPLFLITGISIALNAINNSWLYEGLEEFKYISIRNLIFKVIAFILLVIFVRSSDDLYVYAIITVIGTSGNNILNVIQYRKFVRLKVKGLNFKRHLKPIFFLVAVNLAIEIYSLVDTTMLGIFCPDENVAFYSYGSKINKIFLQIINTFTVVVVPRLSLCYKEKNLDEFNDLLTKTLKIIILLAVPIIVGIQFVGRFFICAVYGEVYVTSSYVLQILSVLLLISPIGYLLGSRVMLTVGQEWKMVICVGIGAVVNVVGNFFLIQVLNEYGAAISSVISEIVVMVIYIILSKKYFHLNRFWDTALKVVLSALIMGAYLFGCSFIPLNGWVVFSIQFVGAVIIYFLILLLFREKLLLNIINVIKSKFSSHKNKVKETNKECLNQMRELSLAEIQQNSFKVLLKFKEICDANGFEYFLAYGTLIGAVRHKGFIPWDDDIDVWMPRSDYEKFINYCIDNDLAPFCLINYKTCDNYVYPISRFVDTRFKIDYANTVDYGLGLFIDIYPLDGANPSDKAHRKKCINNIRKVSMLSTTRYWVSANKFKNIVKYPYYVLLKTFNGNSIKHIEKLDKIAQKYKYEQAELVGCVVWSKTESLKKSNFIKSIDLEFNGCAFKVPVGYDDILRQLYGDYMQLPPEDERVAHHFYSAYMKEIE